MTQLNKYEFKIKVKINQMTTILPTHLNFRLTTDINTNGKVDKS